MGQAAFFEGYRQVLPEMLFFKVGHPCMISNKRQSKVAQGKKMKISEGLRAILD